MKQTLELQGEFISRLAGIRLDPPGLVKFLVIKKANDRVGISNVNRE
jgi:hypothetical protein